MTSEKNSDERSTQGKKVEKCLLLEEAIPMTEEEEINLLDLFLVLLRHKWLIVGTVFFAGAAAVVISLLLPNIYESQATITLRQEEKAAISSLGALGGLGDMVAGQLGLGGGGSLEKLEMVLKSRDLTLRVINNYELMPVIFSDDWNQDDKKWQVDPAPTIQDGLEHVIEGLLRVDADSKKKSIVIGFEHKNPETSKKIVEHYLKELSESLREEVLFDAAQNKRYFKEQLEQTSDVLLKEKLAALLAREIEKETLARAQKYYSFILVDPPIVPDQDKKVKPRRALICILSVVVAFFMAVFLSFIIEYGARVREEDPERYQELVRGLIFWRSG